VFQKFKIDLASETSVVKVFEPFDRVVLHCMKLRDFPQPPPQSQPQHQPSPPPQSSIQAPSSSIQPPFTEPPSSQTLPSFPDAFYNSIYAEILAVQIQQISMMTSQSALLNNQSLLLEHFMNMQLKMDSFEATQLEILDLLKTYFSPPPPSGSNI